MLRIATPQNPESELRLEYEAESPQHFLRITVNGIKLEYELGQNAEIVISEVLQIGPNQN